jgi:capsular exopolysaccharide synthesis family protein
MAMAQVGQKTLIVDADLRKPIKQRVFTMNSHGIGLVDVLAGTTGLRGAIRPTEIDGLDVLEGGQSTSNPSELLNGPAFAVVLEQLKREYDRILIDSPPVGLVTDAQILAALCDSTLLVLRAEESSRILTQRARDALLAVGARVEGVVVNDVSRRNSRYGYYSGYGYYQSHHGSNDRKVTRTALPTPADAHPEKPIPDQEKKEPIHELVYEQPPVNGGPVAKMQASAATHVEPSGDDSSHSKSEVLPLEIREYDSKATRKESLVDSGAQPENGVLTSEKKKNGRKATSNGQLTAGDPPDENGASGPEKKKNGCRVTGKESLGDGDPGPGSIVVTPEKKRNGRKTASNGLPMDAGALSESGTSTPENEKNGCGSTDKGLSADASVQPGNIAVTPEKKKNGCKPTPNGLPTDSGAQPESGALAPRKEKADLKATGKELSVDAGPHPKNRDPAAEEWKKWLAGR